HRGLKGLSSRRINTRGKPVKRESMMIPTAAAVVLAGLAGLSACSSNGSEGAAAAAATDPAGTPVANALGAPLETRDRNGVDYEPAFSGQTRAPGIRDSAQLDVQEVATGLTRPPAFELLPDGRFLVTERTAGALRIVGTDGTLSGPISGVPAVFSQGQGGLLDVALDPAFATNRTIYLSYAEPREGGNGTALAKAVLNE